jgi:hypothetical protein
MRNNRRSSDLRSQLRSQKAEPLYFRSWFGYTPSLSSHDFSVLLLTADVLMFIAHLPRILNTTNLTVDSPFSPYFYLYFNYVVVALSRVARQASLGYCPWRAATVAADGRVPPIRYGLNDCTDRKH